MFYGHERASKPSEEQVNAALVRALSLEVQHATKHSSGSARQLVKSVTMPDGTADHADPLTRDALAHYFDVVSGKSGPNTWYGVCKISDTTYCQHGSTESSAIAGVVIKAILAQVSCVSDLAQWYPTQPAPL